MPPAAPDPQSRGTTGTATTMVVPAARQTGINTDTHTRTVPGSCGGGSVWPGAGLRHDAGLCGWWVEPVLLRQLFVVFPITVVGWTSPDFVKLLLFHGFQGGAIGC